MRVAKKSGKEIDRMEASAQANVPPRLKERYEAEIKPGSRSASATRP